MFIPGEEIVNKIDRVFPLVPIPNEGDRKHDTAKRYRFRDNGGEIGIIASVSEPFCDQCNRIRLTSDGKFRTCLFSLTETDLLMHLRAAPPMA